MGKSLIGMQNADVGADFGGSGGTAISLFFPCFSGSEIPNSGGYQPNDTPDTMYAWPGSQSRADSYSGAVGGGELTAAYGQGPAFTYTRLFWDHCVEWTAPYACYLTRPTVQIPYNERALAACTITLYKNDVATSFVVTITAGGTGGFTDNTVNLTIAAGDVITAKFESPTQDTMDPGFVGASIYLKSFTFTMETEGDVARVPFQTRVDTFVTDGENPSSWPDDPADVVTTLGYHPDNTVTGVLGFLPIIGSKTGTHFDSTAAHITAFTEAEARRLRQMRVRAPGTYSGLRALKYDSNEANDGALDYFGIEANGTVAMSGQFDTAWDTSARITTSAQTYAAVTGDLLNYKIWSDQSTGRRCDVWCNFESDDTWFDIHAHSETGFSTPTLYQTAAPTFTTTETYCNLYNGTDMLGQVANGTFREYWECSIAESMQFKRLRVNVGYFTGGNVTVGLIVDGVKLTNVITVNGTGWFEDTTHTDTVTVTAGSTSGVAYYIVSASSSVVRFDCFEITAKLTNQDGVGICSPDCPDGLTLTGMQDRTLRMLGEDPDNPVYWTAAEIGRHVQDAYVQACRDTKCVQYIEGVVLTEDADEATLSDNVGQVLRATFEDRKLLNVTKWDMDRSLPNWEYDSGYVDRYVTTLHDTRIIGTYKAWDGTAYNSYGPFDSDGAHTYATWHDLTYAIGARVTYTGADGITRAYYAFAAVTTGNSAVTEPEVGSAWQSYWLPIALMVWAVMNPPALDSNCDQPLLPQWCHLGLCFAAAARALRKYGEQRNEALASVYDAIAGDYVKTLLSHVGNRTPERLVAMGRGPGQGLRVPRPWDTEIVD